MTVLGWPLQILALSFAPLVVVQPALASGLLVLLLVAQGMLGESPGRRELARGRGDRRRRRRDRHRGARAEHPPHRPGAAGRRPRPARLAGRRSRTLLRMAGRSMPERDDARRRPRLRLERPGHQVRRRRDRRPALGDGDRLGGRRGRRLGDRPAQRDERAPGAPGDPGRPGRLRRPDGGPGRRWRRCCSTRAFFATASPGVPLLACLAVLLAGATVLARSRLLLALTQPREALARPSERGEACTPERRSAASSAAKRSSERSEAAEPSSVTTTTSPGRSGRAGAGLRSSDLDRPVDRPGAGRLGQDQLADGRAAAGGEVVEVAAQVQGARLAAELAARLHPAQQPGAVDLADRRVAERRGAPATVAGRGTRGEGERGVEAVAAAGGGPRRGSPPAGVRTTTPTGGLVVWTVVTAWTPSTLAARAATSSVESIHVPAPSASISRRADLGEAQPPAGIVATRRGGSQDELGGGRRRRGGRGGRRRAGGAAGGDVLEELVGRVGEQHELEVGHRRVLILAWPTGRP